MTMGETAVTADTADPAAPVQVGGVEAAELRAFLLAFDATFGNSDTPDERVERFGRVVAPERLVAARDDVGEIVGTAGAYDFDMALPGGASAPCAGITVVSVRADHRRRGVLNRMMEHLLHEAADRGEAFAALWASEHPIYGRYGFGPAVPTIDIEVARAHGALAFDGPVDQVRLIDAERAATVFPPLYDAYRRQRPGALSYSPAWWTERVLLDVPSRREGAGPVRYAWLADRGYATYRLRPSWNAAGPAGVVEVRELIALDPEAAAALWRFVIDTDLSAATRAVRRPVDDPLVHLVADTGRIEVTHGDPLFVRLVDVPAALEARGYGVDGEATIELEDRSRPVNAGRWKLVVRDGRGTCARTEEAADLRLTAEVLASVALGGVRTTTLHAAGRLLGSWDAAVQFDRLLATELPPWHGGMF
jgi:predicted acetyltransferase